MVIVESQNGNYYVKDQSAISDFTHYQKAKLAEKYGKYDIKTNGFIIFPNKCDCEQFANCLELITMIPSDLKEFLKNFEAYFPYCYNLNGGDPSCIHSAFVWRSTPEGHKYWSNLNKKYDENRLQESQIDRPREDRSEGNRICCKGNESRYRFSFTRRRKAVKCSKRGTRNYRINIPVRSTTRLRLD